MKKIALYHNLTSGGSKKELYEFSVRFIKDGWTVDLFIHDRNVENFLPLDKLVNTCVVDNYRLLKKFRKPLPFLKSPLHLFFFLINIRRIRSSSKRLAAKINAGNYDMAFIHHNKDLVQSPFILRYLKCRKVYYCAEAQREFYERGLSNYLDNTCSIEKSRQSGFVHFLLNLYKPVIDFWNKPFALAENSLRRRFDYSNIQHSDTVLTNSNFSRENLLAAYGIASDVVYLGTNIPQLSSDII